MELIKRNIDGGTVDDYDDLGRSLIKVSHWLYIMYDGHLGQQRIIHILSGVESMSQKDLQKLLNLKPSSMSEILTKLETKGDIIRTRDSMDRRKVVLRITENGRAKDKRLQEQLNNQGKPKAFDVLTPDEKESLQSILNKLLSEWGDMSMAE